MNKFWKWLIGIVVVLVILGILFSAGMWMRTGSVGCAFGRGNIEQYGYHMNGGNLPYGFGMHRGFGMMGSGGFFGPLISLGILALIVLGIIWLVRSLRKPVVPPAALAPAMTCKNCGQPVESGWRNCPHCGKKL